MSIASHGRRFHKLPSLIVSMPSRRPEIRDLHRVVRQMATQSSRPVLSTTARLQSLPASQGLLSLDASSDGLRLAEVVRFEERAPRPSYGFVAPFGCPTCTDVQLNRQ